MTILGTVKTSMFLLKYEYKDENDPESGAMIIYNKDKIIEHINKTIPLYHVYDISCEMNTGKIPKTPTRNDHVLTLVSTALTSTEYTSQTRTQIYRDCSVICTSDTDFTTTQHVRCFYVYGHKYRFNEIQDFSEIIEVKVQEEFINQTVYDNVKKFMESHNSAVIYPYPQKTQSSIPRALHSAITIENINSIIFSVAKELDKKIAFVGCFGHLGTTRFNNNQSMFIATETDIVKYDFQETWSRRWSLQKVDLGATEDYDSYYAIVYY